MSGDLSAAIRQICRHPGFYAFVALTLSVGIGLNIAAFSLVDSLLLRPVPGFQTDRIVTLQMRTAAGEQSIPAASRVMEWRRQNVRSLHSIEAAMAAPFTLTRVETPRILRGAHLTAGFFHLHLLEPALGRLFQPGDDEPGQPDIVVLSHSFWYEEYGGDRSIIGRTMMLNQPEHRIVGVAPDGFAPLSGQLGVYVPLIFDRYPHFGVEAFARLSPGVSIEQARAEMVVVAKRLQAANPKDTHKVAVVPLGEVERRAVRPAILAAFAATGIVLLVACANIGGILLARGFARRHEYSIRLAIGATRARLVAQIVTESAVLSMLGAAGGLFGARFLLEVLARIQFGGLDGIRDPRVDARALLFSAVLCLVTPILASLGPALSSASGFAPGRRSEKTRRVLVVLQVAAAFLLVCSSGLLVQSFRRLQNQALGYEPRQLLGMHVRLPDERAKDPAAVVSLHRLWKARVAALPGVDSVALATRTPLSGDGFHYGLNVEGLANPEQRPTAEANVVDEDYFRTLGIPILTGRGFTTEDRLGGRLVVVINQAVARRLFPGGKAIGQSLELATFNPTLTRTDTTAKREIIGIVGDTKQEALRLAAPLLLYFPSAQNPYREIAFLVRARGDPERLVAAVRGAIAAQEPDLPVFSVTVMKMKLERILTADRHATVLIGALGSLALVLSMLGAYGVLSYATARRTREFGIRLALGAPVPSIIRLVIFEAAILCIAGVSLGFACYLPLRRLLDAHLFGIASLHPGTLALTSAVILIAGFAAAVKPALRAGRVAPSIALRAE